LETLAVLIVCVCGDERLGHAADLGRQLAVIELSSWMGFSLFRFLLVLTN